MAEEWAKSDGGRREGRTFLMDFVSVCVDGSESVRKAGRGGVAV